jgi:pyruvate/2-oxoglutarate/acetoin dehydrogenase E1 component
MTELKYAEAVRAALHAELAADPDVLIMGEEVGPLGGVFTATKDLFEEFGADRVIDTPISENATVGWAIGVAAEGFRPVVEIMFSDFVILALDQIINLGAKVRFMSNGQFSVPLTIRMPGGGGTNHGPQHSQSLESIFAHIPGLVVAMPATADDAYWMLRDSIRSDDPTIFLESKGLYFSQKAEVDEEEGPRGYGARVARAGEDLTVVSAARMLHRVLEAAERLEADGTSVEVIDLRYIWPLDTATIAASVEKTGKLAVVHEPVEFSGWGAEVAAWAAENLFEQLDGPIARLGAKRVPIPFQPHLEDEVLPSVDRITTTLSELSAY